MPKGSQWARNDRTFKRAAVIPTRFEQFAAKHHLSPEQYKESTRLRDWAKRNCATRYVPEELLIAWNLAGFLESTWG